MKLLTLARDLTRRRARERDRLFVAEGVRAVEELLASPLRIRAALIAPQLGAAPRGAALERRLRDRAADGEFSMTEVDERDFRSAAETESPQGILAIAEIPDRSFGSIPEVPKIRLLVLDAVQDPGNVGTILRTAAALGATATIALPGTVDLWNAKVVRAAMGATFRHHAFHATLDELRTYAEAAGVTLWATGAGGTPLDTCAPPDRLALAVGNEGAGVSAAIGELAERCVSLPIRDVESLNVAIATGIFLYELRA